MNLSAWPALAGKSVKVGGEQGVEVLVHPLSIAETKLIAALYLEPQPPLENRPGVGLIRKVNDPQYAADLQRHLERVMLLEVAAAIRYVPENGARLSVPAGAWTDEALAAPRAWAKQSLSELEARVTWPVVQALHREMTALGTMGTLIEDERKN